MHYAEPFIAKMNSEDFCYAMQARCCVLRTSATRCTCGFELRGNPAVINLAHVFTCSHNAISYTQRHEEIVSAIAGYAKERLGLPIDREPSMFPNYDKQRMTRPDLTIFLPRSSAVIDVTVATNICASYIGVEHPANKAAQLKSTKHGDCVSEAGSFVFFPIALESSGAMDEGVDDFIQHLSTETDAVNSKDLRRELCFVVSTALQRGNARIIKNALARISKHDTPGTRANF
jgi:hypothetical protein